MFVAVSGVSRTLTPAQRMGICGDLFGLIAPGDTLITGGAYGVDSAAAVWAASEGIIVYLYVPENNLWHRELANLAAQVLVVPGPSGSEGYMLRNDAIADSPAEALIAFPDTNRSKLRSGTWATVRRFESRGKGYKIVPLSRFT